MKKASVIGHPISHSLSPAIFGFLSQGTLNYRAHPVTPEELPDFISELRDDLGWVGTNVTLPLKELAISYLDDISTEVKTIGAMNVIHSQDGKLKGYNTDVIGIESTLIENEAEVKGKPCLLLGAGGSAKAVAYVLAKMGARNLWIYNPRSNRGDELIQALVGHFPETKFQTVFDLSELREVELSVVVQTTPIGMATNQPADPEVASQFYAPLDSLKFAPNALGFDLIYVPEETPFIKWCRDQSLRAVGGLQMLVDQAIASWEIWFGPITDRASRRQDLRQFLSGILKLKQDPKPIFLTGFMGVGKTTVGAELARLTQRKWIDADQWIEESAGCAISTIFKNEGEAKFREWESRAVEHAVQAGNPVVSLGGGALMNPSLLSKVVNQGILIFLAAEEATLNARLVPQASVRPLLAGLSPEGIKEKVHALLTARLPTYRKAHLELPTDGLTPLIISQNIIRHLEGASCHEST